MKRLFAATACAFTMAACDGGPLQPPDAPQYNGVATPNSIVNLEASFTTQVFSFLGDGSAVAGAPAVQHNVSLPEELLEDACFTTIGTFTTTTVCITAVQLPVEYTARCESQTFSLGELSLPFDGVLTAYASASLPTSVSILTTLRVRSSGALISSIPATIPLNLLPAPLQQLLLGLLGDQALPFGEELQLGFLARDRTTSDIPSPETLLALLAPLLENPDLISNPLDPALLELVLQPEVLELMRTILPIFIPPMHALHPACATAEEKTINVYFTERANWVQPRSGNEHLNFKAFTPFLQPFAGAIHYNGKKQNQSNAAGYLLSNLGMFFIDLSQLDNYAGNLVQDLRSGVPVQACMTVLPWVCVNTTLHWQ